MEDSSQNEEWINVGIGIKFLLVICLMQTATAMQIQGGKFNTSLSNTSITFDLNVSLIRSQINPISINLRNASYITRQGAIFNLTSDINQTMINSNIKASAFPYILPYNSALDNFSILSNISNTVNLSISNVSVKNCSIAYITYSSSQGNYNKTYQPAEIQCSANTISVSIAGIEPTVSAYNNLLIFYSSSPAPSPTPQGGAPAIGTAVENLSSIQKITINTSLQWRYGLFNSVKVQVLDSNNSLIDPKTISIETNYSGKYSNDSITRLSKGTYRKTYNIASGPEELNINALASDDFSSKSSYKSVFLTNSSNGTGTSRITGNSIKEALHDPKSLSVIAIVAVILVSLAVVFWDGSSENQG